MSYYDYYIVITTIYSKDTNFSGCSEASDNLDGDEAKSG